MPTNHTNIQPDDRLALRINDAVAVSRLGRSTIYKLIDSKKLRSVKIGKRRLVFRESLESLLREAMEMSTSDARVPGRQL
jgi:excisionase family DNA binding protein